VLILLPNVELTGRRRPKAGGDLQARLAGGPVERRVGRGSVQERAGVRRKSALAGRCLILVHVSVVVSFQ
jgi:hypothetical protein